jgi:hypothetical protein
VNERTEESTRAHDGSVTRGTEGQERRTKTDRKGRRCPSTGSSGNIVMDIFAFFNAVLTKNYPP